jgi:hypothetical protein
LGDLEFDLLTLGEFAVATAGDGRVVHKDVGTSPILLDEAESLFRVEPFHGTGRHGCLLDRDGSRSSRYARVLPIPGAIMLIPPPTTVVCGLRPVDGTGAAAGERPTRHASSGMLDP